MNQSVHVSDCHENPDLPAVERSGNRKLVQVAGVVVVNGRPKQVTLITNVIRRLGRFGNGCQLLLRRQRKIRFQATLNHGLMRNGGKNHPVVGPGLRNWLWLAAPVGCGRAGWIHKSWVNYTVSPIKCHYLIRLPDSCRHLSDFLPCAGIIVQLHADNSKLAATQNKFIGAVASKHAG